MLKILLLILLVWLAISLVGFVVKGLFWLGVIGLALFAITSAYGWLKRQNLR